MFGPCANWVNVWVNWGYKDLVNGVHKPTYILKASPCSLRWQTIFEFLNWLVVDLLLWKMMEWKSIGMLKFPIYGMSYSSLVPNHQSDIIYHLYYIYHPLTHNHQPPGILYIYGNIIYTIYTIMLYIPVNVLLIVCDKQLWNPTWSNLESLRTHLAFYQCTMWGPPVIRLYTLW